MNSTNKGKREIFYGNNFKSFLQKFTLEDKNLKTLSKFFKDSQDNLDYATRIVGFVQEACKSIPESSYSLKCAVIIVQKELENFLADISDIKELVQKDIREPLQRFEEDFSASSSLFSKQGNVLFDELAGVRKNAEKARSAYFKSAKDLENAQAVLKSIAELDENSHKIKGKNMSVLEKKSRMDEFREEYKKSLDTANKELEEKIKSCEKLADSMYMLDANRIEMTKNTLSKFINYMEQVTKSFTSRSELMKDAIRDIKSDADISLFMNNGGDLTVNPLFTYIQYEEYQYKNPSLRAIEAGRKEPEVQMNDYTKIQIAFNRAMTELSGNSPWSGEEKATLIEYLHRVEGREVFTKLLANAREPLLIPLASSFKDLGDLINYLLNTLMMDESHSNTVLHIVLEASANIHSLINKKSKYLYTLLASHEIWKDISRWKFLIGMSIREAVEQARKRGARQGNRETALAKPVTEEKKGRDLKKQVASSVFHVLNKYANRLSTFKVNLKEARFLLRDYGRSYGLNIQQLYETELNLLVRQPLHLGGDNHKRKCSRRIMIIKLSIPFIDSKETLRNALLLNSRVYKNIKQDVYRHVLTLSKDLVRVRGQVWMQILEIGECKVNYAKLRKSLNSKAIAIPEHVEGVIKADVQRSFANSNTIDASAVANILRVYAYCNSKVLYCQGMHFIAGFLFYFCRDEEMTFKALAQLLKKFNMSALLVQDIPRYFFQMDRLSFIYFGELSEYLKNLGITSSLYSSTWFLTLFTSILSYPKDEKPSAALLTVWDEFLLRGWSAVFKTGLFILAQLHDKLLTLSFDDVMILLGKAAREILTQDLDASRKLRKFLKEVEVSDEMLKAISKEYDDVFEEIRREDSELQWVIPEGEY